MIDEVKAILNATDQLIAASKTKDFETAKKLCLEIREKLGMAPIMFARELGLSRQIVHAWEKTGKIPLRRAEEIKKLVESQVVKPQASVRKKAESLSAAQVLERITRCRKVWMMKGATAFQSGLFDVVEKSLTNCLEKNEQLSINYVFPDFDKYERSHNSPLKSFLRFKNDLQTKRQNLISRVQEYVVTTPEVAFQLCISASPAGLIILDYGDEYAEGPSRELIVELWDGDEHEVLRKLSDLYASYIYQGIRPILATMERDREKYRLNIDETKTAELLQEIAHPYSYPKKIPEKVP